MTLVGSAGTLLAACGGDTVKLFDVGVGSGNPCLLSYSPSPGVRVNSIKWNHTNLVVASAGDDKAISLWHKNGQSMGTIPVTRGDASDGKKEFICSISFSNKSSRYLCSGGSSPMIKIWDLQRKLCIKCLSGHTDTVTGVMYNCNDEHLASISWKGDLILHNLASGSHAVKLKDPNEQPLRTLDYSKVSRHSLVIAGDDGSVHLWDTTGRSPKVSWLKQHSAPSTGVCFSPSSDKIIASIGLDKKLYTFDSGTRRPTSCIPYETPFASLAYSDAGNILAAGTRSGNIVLYDVRGKPQPFTVLRAYDSSEVSSLCWQRSKPVIVNENTCTAEIALLGSTGEESFLMPDPMPSLGALIFHSATTASTSHSSLTANSSGSRSTMAYLSTSEETPVRRRLASGVSLSKLQAPHSKYNFKDDMDVFSPLADFQPITPSLSNQCGNHDETKKDTAGADKKSTLYPYFRRFTEGNNDPHSISDWRLNATSRQDDTSANPQLASTPVASSKSESSPSPTPPEAWGGNPLLDKLPMQCQPASKLTHFPPTVSLTSGPMFAGIQDSSSFASHAIKSSLTNSSLNSTSVALGIEQCSTFLGSSSTYHSTTVSTSSGTKAISPSSSRELPGLVSSSLPHKYSTYAERISTTASFSDGTSSSVGSPKFKKTGTETKEVLMNSQSVRQEAPAVTGTGNFPMFTDVPSQGLHAIIQPTDQLGPTSFSLQLVQRTLEETLGSVERSIHDDVRNLHIELLRQFHMQETEMTNLLSSVVGKLDELTKEVHSLRRENQQLWQLL